MQVGLLEESKCGLYLLGWLELSGQMAMIDSVIDILKPVKVMVHKLEVTGTLENVNKGNIYVKFPASFLNNNQFLLRNQSS